MIKIFEFTVEKLDKIIKSKHKSNEYSFYVEKLYQEESIKCIKYDLDNKKLKMKNDKQVQKAERMRNCLNFWKWDKYEQNKILDLVKVNRCMDRFCPNCRKIALSIAINNFKKPFHSMMEKNYYPYFLTLTCPNCKDFELNDTINKLNSNFKKLWNYYYRDLSKKGYYKDRYVQFKAGIKMLEITYNKQTDTYNPHLHIMVFCDIINEFLMLGFYDGPYRKKSKLYIKFNEIEMQIMRLWSMLWQNKTLRQLKTVPNRWFEPNGDYTGLYMVNFCEMEMPNGIFEVFKYTYKDTDIINYKVFKTIYMAVLGKRLRQGLGELYNIKIECDEESKEKDESIDNYLKIKESPETVIMKSVQELKNTYQNYKKISRFDSHKNLNNVN